MENLLKNHRSVETNNFCNQLNKNIFSVEKQPSNNSVMKQLSLSIDSLLDFKSSESRTRVLM